MRYGPAAIAHRIRPKRGEIIAARELPEDERMAIFADISERLERRLWVYRELLQYHIVPVDHDKWPTLYCREEDATDEDIADAIAAVEDGRARWLDSTTIIYEDD